MCYGPADPWAPGGPNNPREPYRCFCDQWRHDNEDTSWTDDLPDCPCTIGTSFANPDDDRWNDPEPSPPTHPVTTVCMRSKGVRGEPGQQCCFDSSGDLVNEGPGAGTPDLVAPGRGGGSTIDHRIEDLLPFYLCSLDDYLDLRPPDRGRDWLGSCPSNAGGTGRSAPSIPIPPFPSFPPGGVIDRNRPRI